MSQHMSWLAFQMGMESARWSRPWLADQIFAVNDIVLVIVEGQQSLSHAMAR
jgi:hypothetical protein